jgi:hypothetical protein
MKPGLGDFRTLDLCQNLYLIFTFKAGKEIAYIEK